MVKAFERAVSTHGTQIRKTASILAQRGWAEGNAGNLSIRLSTPPEELPVTGPGALLDRSYPGLAGQAVLVTSAGSRMRDVASDPEENLCVVQISADGKSFAIEPCGREVSSEFPTHAAVQSELTQTKPDIRAVLHTHPTNLIALSHLIEPSLVPPLLIRMYPEATAYLGGNLSSLQYMLPGSEELARATAQAVSVSGGVIWQRHGMLATACDLTSALDLVEVAEKAAHIALICKRERPSAGLSPRDVEILMETFDDKSRQP